MFGLRLLSPARFPGGCYFRLLGHLRDRLRRGIWIWFGGWSGCSLDDMPLSDDAISPLAQVNLLGRGPGPLSSRNGRLACCDALSATLGRLLWNSTFASFHFTQPRYFAVWFPPQAQH